MPKRFLTLLDLDSTLLFGLGTRGVGAVLAPATTLIVAIYLSPELQGYYYTFISLTALQVLVELGITGVITTFASHEWAHLRREKDGTVRGDSRAISRLASLVRFSGRWFLGAGILITILFLLAGLAFFQIEDDVDWGGPWVVLSIVTGLNVILLPSLAILLGCGEIRDVNYYRFVEALLRYGTVWAVLAIGGGLWTLAASAVIVFAWTLVFLHRRHRRFFLYLVRATISEPIDWKQNILPLQWRTAAMWPSGYMMFSLFTPALFHYQGPVLAGQMGMSWALISGISGLASTWLQVRTPRFGTLVAQKQFTTLDGIAKRAALTSFSVALLGAVILFLVLGAVERYFPWWRERLLPTLPIMIFMAAEVLHQLSFAQSSYLRSFKKEPFFWLSIVCGWFVGISTIISAAHFGVTLIAVGYFIAVIIALGWGSYIFVRCRAKWTNGLGDKNGYR